MVQFLTTITIILTIVCIICIILVSKIKKEVLGNRADLLSNRQVIIEQQLYYMEAFNKMSVDHKELKEAIAGVLKLTK